MSDHGCTVNSAVEGGVEGLGLGSQADGDGIGLAVDVGLHEVLVAEGVGEEALNRVIDHVKVGVVVEGNDTAGLHQHILCKVHHCIAILGVGAALDTGDQHVVGLSPGAVLNLIGVAVGSEVDAVHLEVSMLALTVLDVVVTRTGGPHIEEADRIIVVCEPAVSCNGVVAVLTGFQESSPFLVFEGHGDAGSCECALQVLTDRLVTVTRVIEISQRGGRYSFVAAAAGCQGNGKKNSNKNQCENSLHKFIPF